MSDINSTLTRIPIIDTPRLYVPRPSAYAPGGNAVFGTNIFIRSAFGDVSPTKPVKEKYTFWAGRKNLDSVPSVGGIKITPDDFKPFYDLVGYHYDIDISAPPTRRPYVQFIDYVRTHNGELRNINADAIRQLAKNHNILIIPNDTERGYLEKLYAQILYTGRMTPSGSIPKIFAEYIKNTYQKTR